MRTELKRRFSNASPLPPPRPLPLRLCFSSAIPITTSAMATIAPTATPAYATVSVLDEALFFDVSVFPVPPPSSSVVLVVVVVVVVLVVVAVVVVVNVVLGPGTALPVAAVPPPLPSSTMHCPLCSTYPLKHSVHCVSSLPSHRLHVSWHSRHSVCPSTFSNSKYCAGQLSTHTPTSETSFFPGAHATHPSSSHASHPFPHAVQVLTAEFSRYPNGHSSTHAPMCRKYPSLHVTHDASPVHDEHVTGHVTHAPSSRNVLSGHELMHWP